MSHKTIKQIIIHRFFENAFNYRIYSFQCQCIKKNIPRRIKQYKTCIRNNEFHLKNKHFPRYNFSAIKHQKWRVCLTFDIVCYSFVRYEQTFIMRCHLWLCSEKELNIIETCCWCKYKFYP